MQRMRKRRKSNLIRFFFYGRKFRRQCANVINTTWGRIYFLRVKISDSVCRDLYKPSHWLLMACSSLALWKFKISLFLRVWTVHLGADSVWTCVLWEMVVCVWCVHVWIMRLCSAKSIELSGWRSTLSTGCHGDHEQHANVNDNELQLPRILNSVNMCLMLCFLCFHAHR